jgi:hypothetical protein
VRRILLTLILAIVVLAVSVSPALAQVVSPSTTSPSTTSPSTEPCLYTGPVAAGIFDFVNLTPCEIQVASD